MMETDARASSEKHHCPGYKSAPSHSNLFLVVNELPFASNSTVDGSLNYLVCPILLFCVYFEAPEQPIEDIG